MDLLLNALKGQFNTLNLILLCSAMAFILLRLKKKMASRFLFGFAFFVFVITSTGYLPAYLVHNMESDYSPFYLSNYTYDNDIIYVQSLGGGYTLDERLDANSQLSWSSLGRLTEALRVARLFDHSVLVLSGNVASGDESLASVEKRAAISLGFDSTRIILLETASTTLEEAIAFKQHIGVHANLVLVTDALHMPRAMRFFNQQGIRPFAAPTNYLIKKADNPINLAWMPSVENFLLMNRVYREWLGSIKGYILGCYFYISVHVNRLPV